MTQYEPVIGLEVHARIATDSKLFCSCSNDTFGAAPNALTCPVCMGFPGMLPVVNEKAVKKGIQTGLALNCTIPLFSKFDRKSYFYPDLPTGYQISQYDQPVAIGGKMEIFVEGEKRSFGITRLHLENDAGKLSHSSGASLVDWNRAGSPLMEIVTEPDFRSIAEVKAFLVALQKLLRAVGSSDADMEKGQMRADVNVSIRPVEQEKYGTRAEIKNMNSFRAIEKAIAYEIGRQKEILESGGSVRQETLGWDDIAEKTVSQRGKEEAADYRYFPEPDLPPLTPTAEEIATLRASLPELPVARQERFMAEYSLSFDDSETLTAENTLADYFEEVAKLSGDPKKASNWVLSELLGVLKEQNLSIAECKVTATSLAELIKLIASGSISGKIGKEIFPEMLETGKAPSQIVQEKGLQQMSDSSELEGICQKVLDENGAIVADFRGGKEKAFAALIGKTMAATRGQANPQMVNEILHRLLQS